MTRGLFVTGTDTGVGKTVVATMLLRALAGAGHRAVGMKPVAAGLSAGESVHADVRSLIAAGNVPAPVGDINPYSFAAPIAPHIAARAAGEVIDIGRVAEAYARLAAKADVVVVEGAGGALVPLSRRTDMLDIPARIGLPVLLVVGIRLGCLNHALLSSIAVNARGLRLAGWVANRIDPAMQEGDANVTALVERLAAPLLADVHWHAEGVPAPAAAAGLVHGLGFDAPPRH